MKSVIFISLLFLIHNQYLLAQIPKNDKDANSLKLQLNAMKDSPQKVDKTLDIGTYYENVSIDSAITYYEKAYNFSKNIDYKEGIIKCASKQSYMYNLIGDFQKGLEINQKSLQMALQIEDKTKILSVLANIGISYSYLSDYEKALEHYHKALDIALSTNDQLRAAKIYGIIAGTYNNMGQSLAADSLLFNKAIFYNKKALSISRKLKDSILISDNLISLALAYNNSGKMEDAKPYAEEAKTIAKNIGLTNNYAHALSILAKVARSNKQYDHAIRMASEAVSLQKELGSIMGQSIDLKELSLCYRHNGDFLQALKTIDEAIKLAQDQEMDYILDGMYINRAEYLYNLREYKEAYEFLNKGQSLSDSIRGAEIKKQINDLEKKYETAKKEQEIIKLNSKQKIKNGIIIGFALVMIALILFGFIFYKNLRYKTQLVEQEKNQLIKDKQLAATASIIKGQEDERHRLAKDLHDGLGGILSGLKYSLNNIGDNMVLTGSSINSFNNALSMLDQAIAEMRKVAHNMMPESLLKFGLHETLKDYIARMNVSSPMKIQYEAYNYLRLDSTFEINIYRIIQEAINNAIKHAKASDMYIQLDFQSDQVHLTMEDNGIGFDTSDDNLKKGIGLKNISDRVSYMNGALEISSAEGKGTLFVIQIKTPMP